MEIKPHLGIARMNLEIIRRRRRRNFLLAVAAVIAGLSYMIMKGLNREEEVSEKSHPEKGEK